ncbi:MAG: sugar ABC transporter permease [Hamadaea sp.]|nr:sugar ABC transporter permease [Hamadaea sp.]NUR51351.1 sugar ABC transporter permease [Hamadaea sp.]NUT06915.1 sugar ABC transporter permease [Hamadaea sp.]
MSSSVLDPVSRRASGGTPVPVARRRRVRWTPYLFLAPGFLLFVLIMLWPTIKAAQISFYDWSPIPGADNTFVGLDHYRQVFTDPDLRLGFVNAAVYMLVTVPGQILLGLGLALLLHTRMPARTLFRVLFYLPVVTSWVVVSLLFRYLFANDGVLNWFLVDGVHLTDTRPGWLDSRWTALAALCVLGIWKGIGWTAVILLAGLQGVPVELHEAASVDGASYLRRVWHVTLPALRRTLMFVSVLLVIGSFNVFISVLLMTNGGPGGQTEMPLTYLYRQAFEYLDFGYASAIAVVLTLLVLILSMIQTFAFRRADREDR